MHFHVGDRVECLVYAPDGNTRIKVGSTGAVCKARSEFGDVGVRWDDDVGGHNCDRNCTNGHGWFVHEKKLRLYEEEATEDIDEDSFLKILL